MIEKLKTKFIIVFRNKDTHKLRKARVIGSILLVLLVVFLWGRSCATSPKLSKSTFNSYITSIDGQIASIRAGLAAQTTQIGGVQADVNALKTAQGSVSIAQIQKEIDQLSNQVLNKQNPTSAQLTSMVSQISALSDRLTVIEKAQQDFKTTLAGLSQPTTGVIGAQTQTINGLSVVFVSNGIQIPSVTTSVTTAQLAVKITNTNSFNINNLDIIGKVIFSSPTTNIAAGYPTLTDASKIYTYVSTFTGYNTIYFETYGGDKGQTISIPAGGSITLRPVVGLKAAATSVMTPGIITVSLDTIAYDKALS